MGNKKANLGKYLEYLMLPVQPTKVEFQLENIKLLIAKYENKFI